MFSFPRGTEMFQFPRFPLPALCVQTGVTPHDGRRVSPFGYPRIEAWSAAPRGFSQPPTSFIGFRRQGIHRWLFVAWKNKDARARYGVLKGLGARRRQHIGLTAVSSAGAVSGRRKGAGVSCCRRRRQIHSLKTEQRIAWILIGRAPEVPASRRQLPTTGTDRGGAKPVINWEFPSRM